MTLNIISAAVSACLLAYIFGYAMGAAGVKKDMQAQSLEYEQKARVIERQAQEKQDAIVTDYLHQIDEYKKTISAYADTDSVDADRLSDASTCKDMPRASGAQPGLVCYTPADIQDKVKRSLAIAEECDELAIRYKALVKAYQSAYGAKEE